MTACDKAVAILRATRDGEELSPGHLSLLQAAVNGWLSETGEVAFDALYAQVESGGYRAPWFHGIEHLSLDHEGYVYWKGREVEHYNMPWAFEPEGRTSALELARRCRILEGRGETPTTNTAIWLWEEAVA